MNFPRASCARLGFALVVGLLGSGCAHAETDPTATKSTPPPSVDADKPPPVTIVDPRDAHATGETNGADANVADASAPADAAIGAAPPGMKLVPGGTFTMGSEKGGQGDERPAHLVTLAPFFLDVTEITHAEYGACVAKGACRAPDAKVISRFGGVFVGPNKPVTGITWGDTRAYCMSLGKRLPREAELERAVRGDDGRRFPWGNEAPTHERTVFQTSKTEDVGTHPTGRGPYGHDDLAGNVWEWMEDLYDPFAYSRPGAPKGEPGTCDEILAAQNKLRSEGKQGYTGTNPIPTECERSIRGGAYNYDADGLRSTNRVHHPGTYKLLMTGGRCAKDAT